MNALVRAMPCHGSRVMTANQRSLPEWRNGTANQSSTGRLFELCGVLRELDDSPEQSTLQDESLQLS